MTDQDFYQKADYILNHYDRNSHKDKLVLAKELEALYREGTDDGYDDGYNKGYRDGYDECLDKHDLHKYD